MSWIWNLSIIGIVRAIIEREIDLAGMGLYATTARRRRAVASIAECLAAARSPVIARTRFDRVVSPAGVDLVRLARSAHREITRSSVVS